MSTAYPPRLVRYALSSKQERNDARTRHMQAGFFGRFPESFGLFYASPGKDFLSHYFELATLQTDDFHDPRESLYAITFHKGPGLRQMTLYSTPERTSTPLAIAVNERRYSSSATVTLPPGIGGISSNQSILLKQSGSGSSGKYSFAFQGETFEWREDASRKPIVRRLFRIAPSPSTQPEEPPPNGIMSNSDVLATWTEGTIPNKSWQLASFKFSQAFRLESADDESSKGLALLAVGAVLVACQHGRSIESTLAWQEEKKLEKGYYEGKPAPGGS